MRTTRLRPFALLAATAILMSCGNESSLEPSATLELPPPVAWFVAPAAPLDPVAEAKSDSEILVAWTDNSTDESGFEIQRSRGPLGPFSLIARVKANVTRYWDNGLASDVEYCYRVRAFAGKGKNLQYSSYTVTEACAVTWVVDPPSDPRPTVLTAELNSGGIDLGWEDNWDSETNYAIERCVTSTPDCLYYYYLALLPANETTYTDTDVDLAAGLTYCYRVRGLRMRGKKATYTEYSNVACVPDVAEAP